MKKLFLLLAITTTTFVGYGQTPTDKTVKATCDCAEKVSKSLSVEEQDKKMIECFTKSMLENFVALKDEYNFDDTDPREQGRKIGERLGARLSTECPKMLPMFMRMAGQVSKNTNTSQNMADTLKLDTSVCAKYKEGNYLTLMTYMGGKAVPTPDASSYTEVKGNSVTDYSDNGTNTNKWTIKYLSDCEWEQTFVSSTNPQIKSVLKKGDKITMKAIGSNAQGELYVSTSIMGMDFVVKLRKK
jgi:hypothetical protein